ncbi:MAG: hypothetical protein LH472_05055 [Pyrinomonadaceae bacterium]|nr:hypothetical protein [Pyrinomonadaceae bacterium]
MSGNVYQVEGTTGEPIAGGVLSNLPFNVRSGFCTPVAFAPTADCSMPA